MAGEKSNAVLLFKDIMRYRIWYFASIAATAGYLLLELYVRYIMGRVTDTVVNRLDDFFILWISMIIAYFISIPFHGLSTYTKARLAHSVLCSLRKRMGDKVYTVSFLAMQEEHTGNILSRLGSEMDQLEDFVYYGLSFVTTLVVQGTGSVILLILLDPICAAMIVTGVILSVVAGFFLSKRVEIRQSEKQKALGKAYHTAYESFAEIDTVKSFMLETIFKKKYQLDAGDALKAEVKSNKAEIISKLGGEILTWIPLTGAFLYVALKVLKGEIPTGTLVSVLMIGSNFGAMVKGAPETILYLRKAMVSVSRVYEFINLPDEPAGAEIQSQEMTDDILLEISDMWYTYPDNRVVFHGLNLTVRKQQMVAFVGESGVGKTTLIRLICAFLLPCAGRIYFMGTGTEQWDREKLRRHISIVTQDPVLFAGTVREYLALPDSDITDGEMAEACDLVGFPIKLLEHGLDTVIQERGSNFSGGERQRLAIAQALLKPASLLLFDEPTSALDALHESDIYEMLQKIRRNKTVIVISHQLKLTKDADQIVLLDNGTVLQKGTHDELMKNKSGNYARMYELQCRGAV